VKEAGQTRAEPVPALASAPLAHAPSPLLQRACACGGIPGPDGECAACKAKRLQRRSFAPSQPGPQVAPPIVHDALRSPGRPLDPALRGEMEARFGHDFSRVRVHTDRLAAESARSVGAHAYTVGSDIVFGSDRYAPGSAAGADLLAHELAHVVQQRGTGPVPAALPVMPADDPLERAAADGGQRAAPGAPGPRVQRQEVGDRRLRREEGLGPDPTRSGDVWTGTVTRREIQETYRRHPAEPARQEPMLDFEGRPHPVTIPGRPARQGWEETSSRLWDPMRLELDEGACELRIPTRLVFHNPGAGQLPTPDPCGTHAGVPTSALEADVFTGLREAFRNTLNDRLNNWYRLRLEGCGEGAPCSGGLAIRVVATDETATGGGAVPHADVWLINAGGRSCAHSANAFIYAPGGSRDRAMWAHEGGHFVLHFGDEYDEEGHPSTRVQEADYSGMATRNMSSLALLHQRHFAFAPAFANQVMRAAGRSCRASLQELERPFVPVLSETFSMGRFTGQGGSGLYIDLGFHFGVPQTRLRDWQVIIGAHARLLGSLDVDQQDAVLGGIRLGLEHDIPLSRFGYILNTGVYGEAGAGVFDFGRRNELHPYGEAGAYASLRFQHFGSVVPFVGVEAAVGGRLDMPGRIGEPGGGPVAEPPRDAGPTEWTRYGIWLGIQH
jgi:Domain of unknown function (DUF4157)